MNTALAEIVDHVHASRGRTMPPEVTEAARRTLLNVLATTVGAAPTAAVDALVAAATRLAPGGTARIPGRTETLQPRDATLATGTAAHLDDFDDTHLRTVIHAGAVCLAVVVGTQQHTAGLGRDDVLAAVAWGVEVQLRLGNAVSPEHYDRGWHITGTCGAVGAAVTAGLLVGLDRDQLQRAVAWAAELGVGNREGFGSMVKPFHPGKAAANALRLVADAAAGALPEPGDTLTGPDGLATRLADGAFRVEELTGELDRRWELLDNAFKPYPCGIVTHPAIEAAESLHADLVNHGGPDAVRRVRLRCHPLVPELTGNTSPVDGLQARFSTAHGVAAGLVLDRVDLHAYADDVVADPALARLRAATEFEPDDTCARDAAHLSVEMADGTTLTADIDHARGSLARPLDEATLLHKVDGLVQPVLTTTAEQLDAATRDTSPGYVGRLLDLSTQLAGERPSSTPAHPVSTPTADGEADLLSRLAATTPGLSGAALADQLADQLATHLGFRSGDLRGDAVDAVLTDHEDGATSVPFETLAAADVDIDAVAEAVREVADRTGANSTLVSTLAVALATGSGRLDPAHLTWAVGIAATQVTTVQGDDRSPAAERYRLAHRVDAGVEAAVLAAHGFTGPGAPLTGRRGLMAALGADSRPLVA